MGDDTPQGDEADATDAPEAGASDELDALPGGAEAVLDASVDQISDAPKGATPQDSDAMDAANAVPEGALEAGVDSEGIDAGHDHDAGVDPPCANALLSGERLYLGEYRCSRNGVYRFGISAEGDLVLLRRGVPVWSANVCCSAHQLVMQRDGNLVVRGSNGAPLFASNTDGRTGAWLSVENDGRAVVWLAESILWSTAK